MLYCVTVCEVTNSGGHLALLPFIVGPPPRVGARDPKLTNLAVVMQSMAVLPLVMAAQARLDQMVTVPVCHKLNSEFETY